MEIYCEVLCGATAEDAALMRWRWQREFVAGRSCLMCDVHCVDAVPRGMVIRVVQSCRICPTALLLLDELYVSCVET